MVLFARKKDDSPNAPNYADFFPRMIAAVIDVTLATIIIVPVISVIEMTFGVGLHVDPTQGSASIDNEISLYEGLMMVVANGGMIALQMVIITCLVLPFWFYKYSTPGKMLLGLRICDAQTLGPPSAKQLIIRYLGYIPAIAIAGIGLIMIRFNKRCRGLHDIMAGTVVVGRKKDEE